MPDPGRHRRFGRDWRTAMSLLNRTLRKIYPAHDELAVYSMALGIVCLMIFDRELASVVAHGMYEAFVIAAGEEFEAGWLDGIMHLFSMTVLFLVVIFALLFSIYLPFTRRRLDACAALIIVAHSIIMCVANFVLAQRDGGIVNGLIAGGSLIWLLGYFICLRGNRVDYLTDRQASSQEAWIAGVAVFCGIAICSLALGWHWATCYAFSFISAITVGHGARTLNRSEDTSDHAVSAAIPPSQTRVRQFRISSYVRIVSRSARRKTH